jgi:acetyl-CoA acetyltransferase
VTALSPIRGPSTERRRGRPGRHPGRATKTTNEPAKPSWRQTLALAAEEEPAGLHMEAIAKRANVSKETLYRWWHSKTEVILDDGES